MDYTSVSDKCIVKVIKGKEIIKEEVIKEKKKILNIVLQKLILLSKRRKK